MQVKRAIEIKYPKIGKKCAQKYLRMSHINVKNYQTKKPKRYKSVSNLFWNSSQPDLASCGNQSVHLQ